MILGSAGQREDPSETWRRENSLRRITEQSQIPPGGEMPDLYDIPEYPRSGVGAAMGGGSSAKGGAYSAPRWDDERVSALTQKRAMPGLRALRQQVQRVSGRRFDNPQVGRMTLREALSGYGEGIDRVLSGANEAAVDEYGREYGAQADAAKTGFLAKEDRWKLNQSLSTRRNEAMFNAELDKRKTLFNTLYDNWKSGTTSRTTSYNERLGY